MSRPVPGGALGLQHVLVLSDDIERARAFYETAVGLHLGPRPPLPFDGYWLYAGDVACLHIADRASYRAHAAGMGLDVPPPGGPAGAGPVDHLAFGADDYDAVIDRLRAAGIQCVHNQVPGGPRQLFFDDPDGLRVEVNVT